MCGIAGIVRFSGGVDGDADRARLARMRDRLRHRGPDGDGMFVAPQVGLVHTRLALVDPAGGAQPVAGKRHVLVYNGEVYNAAELRAQLRNEHSFRTSCDAEVVLAAYETWGEACVPRLQGMFAFFVWDTVEARGFAARDLLGVKPFVYALRDGEWSFASEAKALVGPSPRANTRALLEYLVVPCLSGVEAPMFEGLHYLPPGHALRVTRDGVETYAWGTHELRAPADDVGAGELQAALATAVTRTLIADAPIGTFLSGGLDSTAIAALAGPALPAFTIAFEDQAGFDYARSRIVISDDGPFAHLAATELGLRHEIVHVHRSTLADDLAAISRTDDALPAWEQELAQHHLARAASASCKAVLVGDAADETHYGYHFLLDAEATHAPRGLIERFTSPIVRADVLPDPVAHFDRHYRALAAAAGHDWSDPVLATTWLVVNRWLPRLLHNGDIHAMAHGLEARVPFADTDLLAVARRAGPRSQLVGAERSGFAGPRSTAEGRCGVSIEKALLREALRGVVPEAIRTRKKSALPKDQRTGAIYQREAARALDDVGPELARVVDLERARRLCAPDHPLDERDRALLFRLVCLAHWAQTYSVRLE